jgi:RNA polymerase sigma factor (sigma-70 family)
LVSEHVKVLAYIHSILRDEHQSEDVYQEVCVLAVQKSASIQDEEHLVKWVRTTARFLCLRALEARDRQHESLDAETMDILEPYWSDRDKDATADWTDALRHCIDLLPRNAKALVEKRYIQQRSYEQIASETGRPVGSLYVAFSRIFTSLRDCMAATL